MINQRSISTGIYLRWSKDDGMDSEHNSIKTQRMMLQRYAKENGLVIFDEYVDDGCTGLNFDRVGFQRMIDDIEDGKVGVVLVKDMSRLGRLNAGVLGYTDLWFPEHDVRFISINDSIDTAHGENEILPFKSVINEYYSRDLSRKIKSSFRARSLAGQRVAWRPPYGYKQPKGSHRLEIDEAVADNVRLMFQLSIEGYGIGQISKEMHNRGIIRPLEYEYQTAGRYGNSMDHTHPTRWDIVCVRQILTNPAYAGHLVTNRFSKKSFRSKRKTAMPQEEWVIVQNTHAALSTSPLIYLQYLSIKLRFGEYVGR
ncbi:hypothetical protein AGMMS49992_32840 [Clostridia bacterium]|nr:hypothetical protein AGMMS49992_32840 [Clostridia bacterium]